MANPLIEELLALLDNQSEKIKVAFMEFVNSVQSQNVVDELVKQLLEHTIENALEIIESYAEHFGTVITEVFNTVGEGTSRELSDLLPDIKLSISFNPTNPRAAEIIAESRTNLIRQLTAQQNAAVMQAIERGLTQGAGAQEIGRAIRNSIGLTSNQEAYVATYRRLLETRDARALERDLRDRRFDAQLTTAIRRDRPLTQRQIDTMVERYRARAVMMRADTIARTEALTAYSQAREEAVEQMVEQTGIARERVERFWNATHDDRVRGWHASMDGQTRPIGVPFTDGLGNSLMYPGDPTAPAETRINCRCPLSFRIKAPA